MPVVHRHPEPQAAKACGCPRGSRPSTQSTARASPGTASRAGSRFLLRRPKRTACPWHLCVLAPCRVCAFSPRPEAPAPWRSPCCIPAPPPFLYVLTPTPKTQHKTNPAVSTPAAEAAGDAGGCGYAGGVGGRGVHCWGGAPGLRVLRTNAVGSVLWLNTPFTSCLVLDS